MAWRPDRHTLLMVRAGTPMGMPALNAAWRAVIWPAPAWMTCPMMTWSTWSGAIPAFSRAPLMATPPRSVAALQAKAPITFQAGERAPVRNQDRSTQDLPRGGGVWGERGE